MADIDSASRTALAFEHSSAFLARKIVEVDPGLDREFLVQPDYTLLHSFKKAEILSFHSHTLRQAVRELLEDGNRPLYQVLRLLEQRIGINGGRLKAISDFDPASFTCTCESKEPYLVDNRPIDLDRLTAFLREQFGETLRQTGVREIICTQKYRIRHNGRAKEYSKEEAMQLPGWDESATFAGNKRTLALYQGLTGIWPGHVFLYNMSGRQPQKHLNGFQYWQHRECHGIVAHELAHGLVGLWTEAMVKEWLQIIRPEWDFEALTHYLDSYRQGIRHYNQQRWPCNFEEEFCDSIRVFSTNVDYLTEKSSDRLAFIRKYYPHLKDSRVMWDGGKRAA